MARMPLVYLVDSAGVYLPLQEDVFPDTDDFGRIFRNNAVISAAGVSQMAAIMGNCVAGGAYLLIMSDEALIVEGTGSVFLAGPYLVKAAIGEDADQEVLGGASTHSEISGVTDYKMPDDQTCLDTIKDLMDKMVRSELAQKSSVQQLRQELADHYQATGFLACESMGEIVRFSLKYIMEKN